MRAPNVGRRSKEVIGTDGQKRRVLAYIEGTYAPLAVILYGSYADGSNNEHSDFDALVVSGQSVTAHDTSFVGDVQLDLFVYPAQAFEGAVDWGDYVQVFDGDIAYDPQGIGARIQKQVLAYMADIPPKSDAQLESDVSWCEKMVLRAERGDAEGLYRWHWVLVDSLEIYCDIQGHPYRGPKKSLRWMAREQSEAYALYGQALAGREKGALLRWVAHMREALRARADRASGENCSNAITRHKA